MKRRLDCAFCGRALPAGCRIDKRYCDQRCVELAYYDRHPEKRAQKLAKSATVWGMNYHYIFSVGKSLSEIVLRKSVGKLYVGTLSSERFAT